MKRLIPAAAVLSLALILTSCAASNDTTPEKVSGGQTKVAASASDASGNAGNKAAEDGFNITYNGVRIALDAEAEPIVKALGKDYMYTENPSCAYVGIDFTYDYKSFIIYAQERNGKVVVNTVEVRDNTVDCGGVKVGLFFLELFQQFFIFDAYLFQLLFLCFGERNRRYLGFFGRFRRITFAGRSLCR